MDILQIVHKKVKLEALSSEEDQAFNAWISDAKNIQVFREYEKLWSISAANVVLKPNVDLQWDKFKKNKLDNNKPQKIRRLYKFAASAAAIIIAIIGVFALFQPLGFSSDVYLAEESPISIQLQDGSTISLNANSSLIVPKKFNKKIRTVRLIGEGLFDVKPNPEVPFVVEMNEGLMVKVLGTKFNVRSYSNSEYSELKVLSGKVLFERNTKNIVVQKGEEADFDHSKSQFTEKREVNANLLAWYTKTFEFDNTPIVEVFSSLERFLNKSIQLPPKVEDLRYTGSFTDPSEKEVAEVISMALGWDYKITREALIFTEKSK